ncbi:hypothetical protein QNK09_12055 [Brevibacillus agri]|uniref:hypothetical protein n=1 Tax=Brevibacillus agri TaxID=51101 RepID=UPI00046ED208|nr:hypothetical protein [Brevibacillus agri]WHX32888.1 hypothetical protein QNK09_12055 [Brevibacillus agri]
MKSDNLKNQFHIYSIDSTALFTEEELKNHKRYMIMREKLEKAKTDLRIERCKRLRKISKENLKKLLKENEKLIRRIRPEVLVDKNIISSFESNFSRVMGIRTGSGSEPSDLSLDVLTIRIYHYAILDSIMKNGFLFVDGEEFIFYTASAGQIRDKTIMAVRKKKFEQVEMTFRVGLTDEMINAKGGINSNKLMAYTALNNSASIEWDIDLDKAIVVDDMEFEVFGNVDYIQYSDKNPESNYKILRDQYMGIPICHTDGAGMYIPDEKEYEAFQIRGGWFKGLMVPFRFDMFIKDKKINPSGNSKVKDVWGDTRDLIAEGIKYVFCKSQFKMWRYYNNWEHYKTLHKEYNCKFAKCQSEPEEKSKRLGYQFLQSLKMSDDELKYVASKTIEKIKKIGHDRNITIQALGIDEDGGKDALKRAIAIYPEMLNDPYSKQKIRDARDSMIKKALYGKLYIESEYAFVSPDWYAFCEWLIKREKNPKGLLSNGKVSCRRFKKDIEIDILRSPSLFREHAIRKNIKNRSTDKWFISNCVYTSTQDLISRILQFDVDGDILLCVSEQRFVEIAKRNMQGIRPLYYELQKAEDKPVNEDSRVTGLKNAFKVNIGLVSNDIAKIWASDNPDLDAIRLLVFENNAYIDYAKTCWNPTRTKEAESQISMALSVFERFVNEKGELKHKKRARKLPHFFIYAKDKQKSECEAIGNGTVDRLYNLIMDVLDETKGKHETIGKTVGKIDYRKMMRDKNIEIRDDIVVVYTKFAKSQWKRRNDTKGRKKNSNIKYLANELIKMMGEIEPDTNIVVDVLVKYLYEQKKSSKKRLLWDAYGDVIVSNLETNVTKKFEDGWKLCKCCGKRKMLKGKKETCNECKKKQAQERKRRWRNAVRTE